MARFIEEIKNRLLPSKILGAKITLKLKGPMEFLGLCPFHNEKTPSFTVSDDKKFYHCFGCGEHGDIFSFLMKTENIGYPDALERLAKEAGVVLPKKDKQEEYNRKYQVLESIYEETCVFFESALQSEGGKNAIEYIQKRKITPDTIKFFRLGFAPIDQTTLIKHLLSKFPAKDLLESKILLQNPSGEYYAMFRGRVIFPIFNLRGKVIAFGGRAISDHIQPKYLNSTDTPLFKKGNELYALNIAKHTKTSDAIMVVEGYMDVISLYQAGFKNSVAPLGVALRTSQIELLWQYCHEPIICLDSDSAGKRASRKLSIEILPLISYDKTIKIAELSNAKDPDELLHLAGKKGVELVISSAKPLSQYLFDTHAENYTLKLPEHRVKLKATLDGLLTKITNFDLKKEFNTFFKEQLFSSNKFTSKKKLNIKDNTLQILETISAGSDNNLDILNVLARFPDLLDDDSILDDFIKLELKNIKLDKARKILLKMLDSRTLGENCEKIYDYTELKKEISLDLEKKSNLDIIKNIEDAKLYVIRLFRLNNLAMITVEINHLLDELKINADPSVFTRLTSLKQAEETLKTDLGII